MIRACFRVRARVGSGPVGFKFARSNQPRPPGPVPVHTNFGSPPKHMEKNIHTVFLHKIPIQ